MSIEDAILRVRSFALLKGWAPSRFARAAGLGANSLRGFDDEGWNPTAATLRKLEAVIPDGWSAGAPVSGETGGAVPPDTKDEAA